MQRQPPRRWFALNRDPRRPSPTGADKRMDRMRFTNASEMLWNSCLAHLSARQAPRTAGHLAPRPQQYPGSDGGAGLSSTDSSDAPTPPSAPKPARSPQATAHDQRPNPRMGPERRRLALALLFSLLIHTLLLGLTFGGQELGLPGFGLPWQDRRIEAPICGSCCFRHRPGSQSQRSRRSQSRRNRHGSNRPLLPGRRRRHPCPLRLPLGRRQRRSCQRSIRNRGRSKDRSRA